MTFKQLYQRVFFITLLSGFVSSAESQAVQTGINTNNILIGEQIKYQIKINLSNSSYQIDIAIPDSIPHFEIIDQKKYDTVDQNGVYTLRQDILFTSFDSGVWRFPSFPISISFPNKATQKFLSDSFLVQVGYSPADSTDQLRDIKPVMDVFVIDRQWMFIVAGILIALILAYLIYRYFKGRKKKMPPLFNANISAYDEATKELNKLQQQVAADPGSIKLFYVTLSDIFKKYYSRKININLMTETTGDLLVRLQSHATSQEVLSNTAQALRSGDAVKFAKYIPPVSENTQAVSLIKNVIDQLEKKSRF